MISYLRLTNIRQHADTELWFDQNDQLVLVGGPNGAGKTTLLEAITWCLYGEHRGGNTRNLRNLVRRGHEIEGAETEIVFDVNNVTYRAKRRIDGKTTAVLYGNDAPIVEGPRETTKEIGRILGMDARGFRLAFIAQQKELDGLANMRPAERGKELTRLLRLDAISAAQNEARARYREAASVAAGLATNHGHTLEDIETAHNVAVEQHETARADAETVETQLQEIDAELAATKQIDKQYQRAAQKQAQAQARADAAAEEHDRHNTQLAQIQIPDQQPVPDDYEITALQQTAADIDQKIGRAEQQQEAAKTRKMLAGQVASGEKQLNELQQTLQRTSSLEPQKTITEQQQNQEQLQTQAAELSERRQTALNRHAAAQARINDLQQRIADTEKLDSVCDQCGQPISDQHVHTQTQQLHSNLETVQTELADTEHAAETARTELADNHTSIRAAQQAISEAETAQQQHDAAQLRHNETKQTVDTYRSQMDRIAAAPVDLTVLHAARTETRLELEKKTQAKQAAQIRAAAVETRTRARQAVASAAARLREAEKEAAGAAETVDALTETHQRHTQLTETRQTNADMLADAQKQAAVAQERTVAARTRLDDAETAAKTRGKHQHDAAVASVCAELLRNTATHMTGRIQPALQGTASELLARLSDGRFTGCEVDRDYNITVAGQPISEYSGGEADLIALAVRLSLANVVADRHNSGGAGFLILDEVFGSQDQQRREAILTALRNLRSTYGQILLTSHVGGLDGAVDRVIDVAIDTDSDGQRISSVSG